MNCQLCQKELDAYLGGGLSPEMKELVEVHLESCEKCARIYQVEILAGKVINKEKELQSNPLLSTRIMTRIEEFEESVNKTAPAYERILRPAVIMISMVAAIFLGILIGNINKPVASERTLPEELALIDDVALESIDLLSNE